MMYHHRQATGQDHRYIPGSRLCVFVLVLHLPLCFFLFLSGAWCIKATHLWRQIMLPVAPVCLLGQRPIYEMKNIWHPHLSLVLSLWSRGTLYTFARTYSEWLLVILLGWLVGPHLYYQRSLCQDKPVSHFVGLLFFIDSLDRTSFVILTIQKS